MAFIHIDYTVDSFYNIYNSEKWPFSNILLVKSFYISHLCSNSDWNGGHACYKEPHFYARPTCRAGREGSLIRPMLILTDSSWYPKHVFKVRENEEAVGRGPGPWRFYTSTGEGLL